MTAKGREQAFKQSDAACYYPETPRAQASRVIEIKHQISGGCLSGTTKECSEFRRTASQTRFLGTFCRAQKVPRPPVRRTGLWPLKRLQWVEIGN